MKHFPLPKQSEAEFGFPENEIKKEEVSMLNKDRIRLMAKLAAYEQGQGKEDAPMGKYRRKDYVMLKMIRTFFYATIAFALLFLMDVLYDMEEWFSALYQMEYREYIIQIVAAYLLFLVFFEVVTWFVYNARYKKGYRNQKLYLSRLRKVEKLYEREEKLLPIDEWED